MGVEIERKFLVDETLLPQLTNGHTIKQGYIQTAGLNTVRVRISDEKAFLTLKSSSKGATRLEFEYPVPLEDAQLMLENLCQKPFIDKKRYLIAHEGHTWELDILKERTKDSSLQKLSSKVKTRHLHCLRGSKKRSPQINGMPTPT